MTLLQLAEMNIGTMGTGTGFVIRSLAHPDRKFKVVTGPFAGKFGITRLDNGTEYLVDGTSDRYEFAINPTRIRELNAELNQLTEQKTIIESRLATVTFELEGMVG